MPVKNKVKLLTFRQPAINVDYLLINKFIGRIVMNRIFENLVFATTKNCYSLNCGHD